MNVKNENTKVVTFFGQDKLDSPIEVYLRLQKVIENLIKSGVDKFIIDSHGEFGALAIKICNQLKDVYFGFDIERVIYKFVPLIDNIDGTKVKNYYQNVTYFLSECPRGIAANRKLIDRSDIVVLCYNYAKVNSAANDVCAYSMFQNKKIIDVQNCVPRIFCAS